MWDAGDSTPYHPTQNAFTHHVGSSLAGPKIAGDYPRISYPEPRFESRLQKLKHYPYVTA
jgi:hypothetical protein